MRVLQAKTKRPLDVLAIGSGGHIAAAGSLLGLRPGVEIWEIATGRNVSPPRNHIASSLTFTLDGKSLFVGGAREAFAIDIASGQFCQSPLIQSESSRLVCSPDGSRLFVTDVMSRNGRSRMTCYALSEQNLLSVIWADDKGPTGGRRFFYSPTIRPDGLQLAVYERDATQDHPRQTIQIRDTGTGKVLTQIPFDPADPIQQLAFSADNSKLLARTEGRTVKVFAAANGQPAGELVHPGRPYVTGMAVHPNGTVACSRNNGTVCFWNLDKREIVRTLDWKLGKLVSVAFAPDGSIGAAGTEDGQVIVWDVDA